MSLAWFSGPLAGLLVQPIVGILSDNSTSKYGSSEALHCYCGYINLEYFFPFFGGTQLQVPCVFTSIILLVFDALTCWATPEKVNKSSSSSSISIWTTIKGFPFLFYTTSWVAEIYIHTIQAQQQLPFNDPINSKLKEEAERTCPFSLLFNWFMGYIWDVAMWAPFSIIGEFAAKETKVGDLIGSVHRSDDDDGAEYKELENMCEVSVVYDGNMEYMPFLDHNQFDDGSIRSRSTRNNGFDAGILLGINNIYCHTTVLLLYFFSSAAFALVKHHDHITPGNNSNETTIDAMNGQCKKKLTLVLILLDLC
ncbi:hypothetical protein C2G38_2161537 [Gigaspora rosea]|uniref:Uncharacterized protein n=1 Tax=Gigaspora rosea TaxID=44941 RepID=A0A397VX38_9GLOM|nr:hypothetical protein C2G38_2161537 [Gigaspora rosea]